MLLRTLFKPTTSPSIRKLHRTAGLRVCFETEADRDHFQKLFAKARDRHASARQNHIIAVFQSPGSAEEAHRQLIAAGVANRAISLLWRAGQFVHSSHDRPAGHSKRSVVAASAGAGLAGAAFGITMLAVPGIGLMAAGGAAAAQAMGTIGAVGGALGATGGAIARMLSDFDVSDREVPYYEMAISEGKVFVAVDPTESACSAETIRAVLEKGGGAFIGD